MGVPFYMDVHVPYAITEQLRHRGIDVLTAWDDGSTRLEDHDVLEHAMQIGRLVFTQDIRFKAMAEDWQRTGRAFARLVFGHQMEGTIGQFVKDLELIGAGRMDQQSGADSIPVSRESLAGTMKPRELNNPTPPEYN